MPDGITVSYVGMQRHDDKGGSFQRGGPHLKFIVHNGTDTPINYSSNSGPDGAFSEVRIDGNKQPDRYSCGSGAMVYSVEPKMSAEIRVYDTDFEVVPRKKDMISVGFYLRDPQSGFKEIYSEPFILPEQFRDSVKKWRKEVDSRRAEATPK